MQIVPSPQHHAPLIQVDENLDTESTPAPKAQDSERTLSVVKVVEATAQERQQASLEKVDSPLMEVAKVAAPQTQEPLGVGSNLAEPSTKEVNSSSTLRNSLPRIAESEVVFLGNDQALDAIVEQVLKEFDPQHRLLELSIACARIKAKSSSFDDKL